MLKENIYLNDIYFFIQQGLVKLHSHEEVQHQSGRRYIVAGEAVEFDEVLRCREASHKLLDVRGCRPYSYSEHLYGIWNRANPNLYYLGTTRPYTGAFGCIAEMSALFVHRMITNDVFSAAVSRQFPAHMHEQRVLQNTSVSEPDKLHVQWAGMHCMRISKTLGCDMSYAQARRLDLRWEWKTGPIHALRCRIVGPYALPGAAARYKRSCAKIHTNFMVLNMIYRDWGDQMVVASWLLNFFFFHGMTFPRMTELEKFFLFVMTMVLVKRSTPMSQLRGLLMMMSFDSLYHTRAWVVLFSNAVQFLFSVICVLTGSDYGVPLPVRLGLPVDAIFLVLGRLSYPRAFFGDMRVRTRYADWLFKTYLRGSGGSLPGRLAP